VLHIPATETTCLMESLKGDPKNKEQNVKKKKIYLKNTNKMPYFDRITFKELGK
jgi:hypothetical protein